MTEQVRLYDSEVGRITQIQHDHTVARRPMGWEAGRNISMIAALGISIRLIAATLCALIILQAMIHMAVAGRACVVY